MPAPARTAVDARGCPTLFATEASFELTGVTFETSSAVIRPIWYSLAKLDSVAAALSEEQLKLYRLIWQRALASQMAPKELETTTAELSAGRYQIALSEDAGSMQSRSIAGSR